MAAAAAAANATTGTTDSTSPTVATTTTTADPSTSAAQSATTATATTTTTETGTTTEGYSVDALEEWAKTYEALSQAQNGYAELQRQELLIQQQQQVLHGDEPKSERSLWVGGIPPHAKQMDIDNLFNKYGTIDLIKINSAKACAFIKFRDKDSATNAFNNTYGTAMICGQNVRVGWAKNDAAEEETFVSSTAWAGNVDPSATEQDIRRLFAPYGDILQIRMLPEKMCAFINYADQDSVRKAKNALNGYTLKSKALKIGYGKVYH